jgi:hypothetical protein
LILVLTIIVASGQASPARASDPAQNQAVVASWVVTAQFTLNSWLAGSITRSFALQALKTSSGQLETAARALDMTHPPDIELIAEAIAAVGANDQQRAALVRDRLASRAARPVSAP